MFLNAGVIAANLINYGTQRLDGQGWCLSLGLAAFPTGIMMTGSLGLPETPNSLMERGHQEKARAMLEKIRGTPDVQEEFDDLVDTSEALRRVKHPFRNILMRKYRPHLVMAIAINFFQQLSRINVITFYAPILFKTLSFRNSVSLFSVILTGPLSEVGAFMALVMVDKIRRRFLFIMGGIVMFISQVK